MTFYVEFTEEERKILKKHNIVIINNERNYIITSKDDVNINISGSPTKFKCGDFTWEGLFWKDLLISFATFVVSNTNLTEEELLKVNFESNDKNIFSKRKKSNHYYLKTAKIYINGNPTIGNLVWKKIIQLSILLKKELQDYCEVYIHYDSAQEPREVIQVIWNKEIRMFLRYLQRLRYNKEEVLRQGKMVSKLNSVYRKLSPNTYFFLIDRKEIMSRAISRLKSTMSIEEYKPYASLIENISNFKKELYYSEKLLM
ncbi:MAG TPA: hypothetical protein GX708_15420 [Gallicola sp.]|jgi:hypothetical protein|nr:hypothetical protein [Gallicola sp.]